MSAPWWITLTNSDGTAYINVSHINSVTQRDEKVWVRMTCGSLHGPYHVIHVKERGLLDFIEASDIRGLPPRST